DLAVRYGGEEFAVLLPNTDAAGCAILAEELRAGIESLRVPHAAHPSSDVVTISIGAAVMMPIQADLTAIDLIAAADRALYDAKTHRN
ncbi:diguanylate cyclase, partial [Klebsiella pneumoniae]|uniref:diguanylate cyclase n=1 Tax=Klebsiella pneumoniae TaxID=573 RepID=UPI003853D48D